jgi:hypothetical protein
MFTFLLFFGSFTTSRSTVEFFIPTPQFAFISPSFGPQYDIRRDRSTCFIAGNRNNQGNKAKMMSNTLKRDRSSSPLSTRKRPIMGETKNNDRITTNSTSSSSRTTRDSVSTSSTKNVAKEPIYITVGPQGAGKTTLLSKIRHQSSTGLSENLHQEASSSSILDIAIDDQRGVYLKIPVELFSANSGGAMEDSSSILYTQHSNLLQYNLHNKTISQRINDPCNDEMRYVTQRLCNKITRQDFEDKIKVLYTNHSSIQSTWQQVLRRDLSHGAINQLEYESHGGDLIACLVEVVEELNPSNNGDSCTGNEFPVSHVDLYVSECIFKELPREDPLSLLSYNLGFPNNVHVNSIVDKQWFDFVEGRTMSGLAAAISKLGFLAEKDEFQNLPLAWGNTNSVSTSLALESS